MLGMFGENCITAERLLVEFGVYAPQLRSQKKFSTLVLKINPPPVPNGKTLTLAKILNHPPPPRKNSKPQENARFLHKYPTV